MKQTKENIWQTEWPTKDGFYWFYGSTNTRSKSKYELISVKVRSNENSTFYIQNGGFMYKRSSKGVWQPAITPKLDELINAN